MKINKETSGCLVLRQKRRGMWWKVPELPSVRGSEKPSEQASECIWPHPRMTWDQPCDPPERAFWTDGSYCKDPKVQDHITDVGRRGRTSVSPQLITIFPWGKHFIKAQYLEYYYNVPDHHLWNFLVCPWGWFGELSVFHLYFLPTGPPPWRGASLVVKRWRICLQFGRPGFYSLSQEDPLEKGMATHSSILARRIPWTEEPRGLQSMGSQSRTQMSDFHFPKGHCILFSLPFLLVSMVQKPIPLDKAPPPPGSLSQSF